MEIQLIPKIARPNIASIVFIANASHNFITKKNEWNIDGNDENIKRNFCNRRQYERNTSGSAINKMISQQEPL